MSKPKIITHEAYVQRIYALAVLSPGLTTEDRARLGAIKLSYGAGPNGARGVTYFKRWARAKVGSVQGPAPHNNHGPDCGCEPMPFVAICATEQEGLVQVCGTTLHELGHVLAGLEGGHGPAWHTACAKLGLINVQAAGTAYSWENFEPGMRAKLQRLAPPTDGAPVKALIGQPLGPHGALITAGQLRVRPCGAGFGTRGGHSRGTGSGSRLLKYVCECQPKPVIVRHAGSDLQAKCLVCGCEFVLDEASLPAAHGMGQSGQGVPAATARKYGARKPLAPKAKRAKPPGKPPGKVAKLAVNAPLSARARKDPDQETMLAAMQRLALAAHAKAVKAQEGE